MSRTNAPVGFTCPDIDSLISCLQDQVKELRGIIRFNDLDSSVSKDLDNIADNIEETYYRSGYSGKNGIIETLRKSNDELRSWGEELHKELEELKSTAND